MLTLEDDALASRVKRTMGELLDQAEQLKGLALTLDGFCGLRGGAAAEEIKQVSAGVRAAAVHAVVTASTAVGLSERLSTVAAVLEEVQQDSAEQDEREDDDES